MSTSASHGDDALNRILRKPVLHATSPKPDKTKSLGGEYQFPTQKAISKIDAENPVPPPELHKWSTPAEMCKFLTMLLFSNGSDRDDWFLDMQPIGFSDEQVHRRFKNFPEVGFFRDFSAWIHPVEQTPLPHTQGIGLFCDWTKTWEEKDGRWVKNPWVVWVAVLRPLKNGMKDLIIWDPDHPELLRKFGEPDKTNNDHSLQTRHLLTPMQTSLVKHIVQVERMHLRSIWIGGKGADEGQHLQSAGEFIRGLTSHGWKADLPWDSDSFRAEEFHRVGRVEGFDKPKGNPTEVSLSDKLDGFEEVWELMPEHDSDGNLL